ADFLLGALRRPDGGLLRTWRTGRAHLDAYLEDYAFFAEGLVDLYEAGAAPKYLAEAAALAEKIRLDFGAEEGGFFSTARGHEPLIVRPREGHDGAIPSANAAAAMVLARPRPSRRRPAPRPRGLACHGARGRPRPGPPPAAGDGSGPAQPGTGRGGRPASSAGAAASAATAATRRHRSIAKRGAAPSS